MKVCLIRPPQLLAKSNFGNKAAVPLGIAFLGAVLEKNEHDVTLIDAIAEDPESLTHFIEEIYMNGLDTEGIISRIPLDAEVIGFSLMFTMNWLHDRSLIQLVHARFPKALIIAGGEHITALPEFSMKQTGCIDICVLGEGEQTVVDLLSAVKDNQPLDAVEGIVYKDCGDYIRTGKRSRMSKIDDLPWPAWHLLPVQKYFEHAMVFGVNRGNCLPIMASRGCPYRCTFCSSPDMWGTRYVLRSEKDVADEIEFLHKKHLVNNIDFYDLTAIIKRPWIVNFCKELISRKLNITWQLPSGTRSEAIDNEVAELMYQSGCRNVSYAPESGSPELLKIIMKKVNLKRLLQSAKDSARNGLNVKVNIIVGLPEERHRHIWKTIWFLIKCSWVGVNDTTPGLFYPYPGSRIFNDLMKKQVINLDTDSYFMRLIYSDSFIKSYSYSENLSVYWIRFYQALILFVFYSTNYLFRPLRLYKTIKNILTSRHESRFEMTITDMFKTNKLSLSAAKPHYENWAAKPSDTN